MDKRYTGLLRRGAVALSLALGLGGCVYAPPYAYDGGYPTYGYPSYGYPTYVGPPVTLDFGFSYYDRPRYHHGYHHGGRHGGSYHRGGGWRGRGRH